MTITEHEAVTRLVYGLLVVGWLLLIGIVFSCVI